jgi:hypothetical protein
MHPNISEIEEEKSSNQDDRISVSSSQVGQIEEVNSNLGIIEGVVVESNND